MKRILLSVLFFQLASCIVAFSPSAQVKKVNISPQSSERKYHFHLFSIEDENDERIKGEEEEDAIPTPETDKLQQKASKFSSEKVPLLGEIPADGSIVVLAPVAAIAVLGFIMSINIAINSGDAIVQQIDQVTNVLSTPPAKKAIVSEGCRGLCSDQEQQLDNMRSFMQSLAPKI
jgi:hypothetical protein